MYIFAQESKQRQLTFRDLLTVNEETCGKNWQLRRTNFLKQMWTNLMSSDKVPISAIFWGTLRIKSILSIPINCASSWRHFATLQSAMVTKHVISWLLFRTYVYLFERSHSRQDSFLWIIILHSKDTVGKLTNDTSAKKSWLKFHFITLYRINGCYLFNRQCSMNNNWSIFFSIC